MFSFLYFLFFSFFSFLSVFLIYFFLPLLSLSLFIGQRQGKRDFFELLAVSCLRETPCFP